MKRLLIILVLAALLPAIQPVTNAAYTLDHIYGGYDGETPPRPYLRPSIGFKPLDVEEIQLQKSSVYFHFNEEEAPVSLGARLMPINCEQKKITYSSSDETVAAVDENGTVTSKNKLGSAIITASCGDITAECRVNVIIAVTGVAIEGAPRNMYADKPAAAELRAVVTPDNAGLKDVKWETSDASIATVNRNGIVMPCGVGEVTITATTKDRGFSASCKINVTIYDTDAKRPKQQLTYSHYNCTLEEAVDRQLDAAPTIFTANAYEADRYDVEFYIDPAELVNGAEKYQFLDLSVNNGVSADALDAYLNGKGVLDGMGSVFLSAAREYGISEVYLAVHACLESGNGMSQLANGVEYNGEIVYNMFGIGAIDAAPVSLGARYACENGWTSVESAIEGGAEWISRYYINNSDYKQNTLYKMRWNPANPGIHQYATDVAWASKQAETLRNMFAAFPSAMVSFDYPVYKGAKKLELSAD